MMKRITFDGLFCDIAKCEDTPGGSYCENGTCSQRQVWERLKAIENILGDTYDLEHIRDLLQAEQDGRLVVLPKPSDTDVYIVYYDECGAGGMCLDYPYCDDCKDHTPKIREAKLNCTMVNSIGKTVFLTREEAEAAIKEVDHA